MRHYNSLTLSLFVLLLQACGGGGGGSAADSNTHPGSSAKFIISAISGNTSETGTTANFTVHLSSQPTADVTIPISSSDTSEGTVNIASLTFTNSNWNTNQTVTVTGSNDLLADGNVAYSIILGTTSSADTLYNGLNPTDVAVINTDVRSASFVISAISGNTSENGTTATFTVRLGSQPTANVTIPISSSDTSEGTVAIASLTFNNSNWNTNQTVTVTGVSDADASNVTYSIVLGTTVSSDIVYNSLNPDDVAVTNTNIDVQPAGFVISAISGNTSESGTTATFTVSLGSQPTANVIILLTSSDLTEGTVNKSSLTFTNSDWGTIQTVTVTGVNDALADGNITYGIVLDHTASNDPLYNGLDPTDVAVTNIDVRSASFVTSAISGHTSESGAIATFTVRLGSQPTADVTIPVSSSDTSEGTVAISSLTFTNANWGTAQSVTVTGVGDIQNDGNVDYSIILGTTSSADTIYNNQNPADFALTNDNVQARELTVTWDYYDTNYVTDYSVKGIRVHIIGFNGDCYSEDLDVINTTKTKTCDVPADFPTPVSFTLTAYDALGLESPNSEVFEAVPGL